MSDKFANVVGRHGQDERLRTRLEQMDQHFQHFAVLLHEAGRVLTPETLRLVNGAPLEPARLDLGCVLVERAQVLDGNLQLVVEELDVGGDVFVVELVLLQDGQLFENFGLHHGHAILLGDGSVFGLFDHVAKHGQDDARHFILDRIVKDVSQNGNDFVPAQRRD